LIRAGLSKFNQEFARDNNAETISCRSAVIKLPQPKMLQLDGELIEEVDRIEAKMLAGAVKMVTTGDNPFL
jgi:diacylglycerol kinase family enzyme